MHVDGLMMMMTVVVGVFSLVKEKCVKRCCRKIKKVSRSSK